MNASKLEADASDSEARYSGLHADTSESETKPQHLKEILEKYPHFGALNMSFNVTKDNYILIVTIL